MAGPGHRRFRFLAPALAVVALSLLVVPASGAATSSPDDTLDAALQAIVAKEDGPPGIAVLVQRDATPVLHTAGVADTATDTPITEDDAMRIASVAKAFSGAAAISLLSDKTLSFQDTVGAKLPDLPKAWSAVTLAQLLQHTSGIPDFSGVPAFREAVGASVDVAPPPAQLLSFVADQPLGFEPGTKYRYSNSDNVIIALMVQVATGKPYEDALAELVSSPMGLTTTSLPAGIDIPSPTVHGYLLDPPVPPEDVTQAFAAGWAWASGGVVSTPADLNRFVRAYASGETASPAAHRRQLTFRAGSSGPPGPGTNAAGLGIYRYRTRCGTVYGHTGNTAGYTQFMGASRDGKRSAVVSVNAQITPGTAAQRFKELREIDTLAVCAALKG